MERGDEGEDGEQWDSLPLLQNPGSAPANSNNNYYYLPFITLLFSAYGFVLVGLKIMQERYLCAIITAKLHARVHTGHIFTTRTGL